MLLRCTLILYFILPTISIFSQVTGNPLNTQSASFENQQEPVLTPLKLVNKTSASYKKIAGNLEKSIRKFSVTSLADNYQEIQKQLTYTNHFILQLPDGDSGVILLKMVKHSITTPDFVVKTSDGKTLNNIKTTGSYFTGTLENTQRSIAAISFDQYGIKGFISNADGNKVIEGLPQNKNGLHILYNDKDVSNKPDFRCTAKEEVISPVSKSLPGLTLRPMGSCKTVKMYIECSYAMYQANHYNVDDVINFVFSVFNASAAIFKNDGINIQISEMLIWTQPEDIYQGVNDIANFAFRMQTKLSKDFQRGEKINADIAHFITPSVYNGGITIGNILLDNCGKSGGFFACAASSSVNPFPALPAYSWTIHVFTHETGHLLGSPHTQSCSWPGGAIDNCRQPEGDCPPGPAPVTGGTIMSYCHNTSYGVNFLNGFGPLPSALIRDAIDKTDCISTCADTSCSTTPLQGVIATVDSSVFKLQWKKEATKYKIGLRPNTSYKWQYYEVINADSFVLSKTFCETFYDYSITPFCPALNKYSTSYISMAGDTASLQLKLYANDRYSSASYAFALCAADSMNLLVSPAAAYKHKWYVNGLIQPQFISDSIRTPSTGQYSVSVNSNGCNYYSDTIAIVRSLQNPRIVAAFNDLSVDFSANSSCTKTYLWDFGDGSTSAERAILHHFPKKGIYNISLKVWDAEGNMEQVQKPLQLSDVYIDSLNGTSIYSQPNKSVAFSNAFCRQVALFTADSFKLPLIAGIIPSTRLLYINGNTLFKSPKTGTIEFKLFPQRGLIRSSGDNNPVVSSDTGYVLNISQVVNTETNKFFLFFSKWGGVQVAVDSIVLGSIANGVSGPLMLNEWNTIGISYGDKGIYVMVNGQLYASDPHSIDSAHASLLGRFNFGTYLGRIGYSGVTPRLLKGFEGALDLIRFSLTQKDFTFSAVAPWQGTDTVTINKKLCNGDSYLEYTTSGTYFRSSVTAAGCDSITRINLLVAAPIIIQDNLVHPIDLNKGNIFISNSTSTSDTLKYEWNTGATTKDLTNIPAGKYTLKITNSSGCEKTFVYTLYQLSSHKDYVSLFPNPVTTTRPLLVRIGTTIDKIYTCIIYDVVGKKYLEKSIRVSTGINELEFVHKLRKGVYVIHLQTGNEKHSIKFYVN